MPATKNSFETRASPLLCARLKTVRGEMFCKHPPGSSLSIPIPFL